MHGIEEQYTVLITPFLLVSAVEGYRFLQQHGPPDMSRLVIVNLGIWGVGSLLIWGPLGRDANSLYTHTEIEDAADIRLTLQQIPGQASVSAPMQIGPIISQRTKAFHFPNPFQQNVWGANRQALVEIAQINQVKITPQFQKAVDNAPVEYVIVSPSTNSVSLQFQRVYSCLRYPITLIRLRHCGGGQKCPCPATPRRS